MELSVKPDLVPHSNIRAQQRPPGSLSDVLMHETCTGCGDCAAVCPASLVLLDHDGLPVLMSSSMCLLCGLCAEVCTPSAIELTETTRDGLDRILDAESQAMSG